VRTLDPGEIAVLEYRAGAVGDVVQHGRQPGPATNPSPRLHRRQDPLGGGAPGLTDVGQEPDRGIPLETGSEIEHRVLHPQPRWACVPGDSLRQRGRGNDPVSGCGQQSAVQPDREEDRSALVVMTPRRADSSSESGLPTQGRRLVTQHSGPGPLGPARRSRVVEEHTWHQPHPLPTAEQPLDVGRGPAVRQHLTSADEAVLQVRQSADLVHRAMVDRRLQRCHRLVVRLWRTVPVGCRRTWCDAGAPSRATARSRSCRRGGRAGAPRRRRTR
jgi:hypothetical protein